MNGNSAIAVGLAGFFAFATVGGYLVGNHPPDLSAFVVPQQELPAGSNNYTYKHVKTQPDPITVCERWDATGLMADKCEYSTSRRTITITVNMTTSEAQKCQSIADAMGGYGLGGWTLRIATPYSGEKSIAMCDLGN